MQESEKEFEEELIVKKTTRIDFSQGSIKMWVLKMGIPGIIMMLTYGLYTFADSILSVQFAPNAYTGEFDEILNNTPFEIKDLVRSMMSPTSTIVNTIGAIAILFSQGAATRHAINMGRGDIEKAKNNIRTGTMYSVLVTIIMMPILISISNTWIGAQMPDGFEGLVKYSAEYADIITYAMPFIVLNQIMTFILRNEGKNKAIMLGMILPIGLNLLLDWLFMNEMGMGINGGAWATFASHVFTFTILVFFAYKDKSEYVKINVMFGLKMKHTSLVGIVLVGMASFLSNMSFAITQTLANQNANAISEAVYPAEAGATLFALTAGVWPIFMLAFPVLFGFVQGITPIAAFNYGKKEFGRVKETVKWTMIFSLFLSVILFVLLAVILSGTLLTWLGTNKELITQAKNAVLIAMSPVLLFAVSNGASVFFGSTDRVWRNLYCNIAFGIIWYIPMLYVVKAIAINNTSYEFWYWYTWLFTQMAASLTQIPLLWNGMLNIEKQTKSLDEIILNIEHKLIKKFKKNKA